MVSNAAVGCPESTKCGAMPEMRLDVSVDCVVFPRMYVLQHGSILSTVGFVWRVEEGGYEWLWVCVCVCVCVSRWSVPDKILQGLAFCMRPARSSRRDFHSSIYRWR